MAWWYRGDEAARVLFGIREVHAIVWVNPVSEHERMRKCLEDGAPPVDEWKLGYRV